LGSLFALVAFGFTIVYGIGHIMNWAHGEFYMLGAVGTWLFVTHFGFPFILAAIISIIAVIVFALIIERTMYKRLRFLHLPGFVASYGLLLILQGSVFIGFAGRSKSLDKVIPGVMQLGNTMISNQRLFLIPVAVLVILACLWFIQRTKYGIAIRAGTQDGPIARLYGINMDTVCSIAMGVGAAAAVIAGILIAPLFVIEPYMSGFVMWNAWIAVCLGGRGNLGGTLAISGILGLITSVVQTYIGMEFALLVTSAFFLIGLAIRPRGLWTGYAY